MMKILWIVFVLAFCAPNLFAQARELARQEFERVLEKGNDLKNAVSHIETRTLEYFEDRDKQGHVSEQDVREVLISGQWRTVEVRNDGDTSVRSERLWDGRALYVRNGDGPWTKLSGWGSGSGELESGRFDFKYCYLGRVTVDGRAAELYEVRRDRIAKKTSATRTTEYHYVRITKYWFLADGRLLKMLRDETVDGSRALSRETTDVDYNTKDLKIEAPI